MLVNPANLQQLNKASPLLINRAVLHLNPQVNLLLQVNNSKFNKIQTANNLMVTYVSLVSFSFTYLLKLVDVLQLVIYAETTIEQMVSALVAIRDLILSEEAVFREQEEALSYLDKALAQLDQPQLKVQPQVNPVLHLPLHHLPNLVELSRLFSTRSRPINSKVLT